MLAGCVPLSRAGEHEPDEKRDFRENVVQAASEEPGVVSYISQLMHMHQISILNLRCVDAL